MTIKKVFVIIVAFHRGVAQLVARSVRDAEVVGSIPVASTKNTVQPQGFTVFFCPFATVVRKHALSWGRARNVRMDSWGNNAKLVGVSKPCPLGRCPSLRPKTCENRLIFTGFYFFSMLSIKEMVKNTLKSWI